MHHQKCCGFWYLSRRIFYLYWISILTWTCVYAAFESDGNARKCCYHSFFIQELNNNRHHSSYISWCWRQTQHSESHLFLLQSRLSVERLLSTIGPLLMQLFSLLPYVKKWLAHGHSGAYDNQSRKRHIMEELGYSLSSFFLLCGEMLPSTLRPLVGPMRNPTSPKRVKIAARLLNFMRMWYFASL